MFQRAESAVYPIQNKNCSWVGVGCGNTTRQVFGLMTRWNNKRALPDRQL